MSSLMVHSARSSREAARLDAVARVLFLGAHPFASESTWALVDGATRAWWVDRARPVIEAVEGVA